MVKPKKLSPAMLRVLDNLAKGLEAADHIRGMSQSGGFTATAFALVSRGLMTWDYTLTKEGWEFVHQLEAR